MIDLAAKKCQPCEVGTLTMTREEVEEYLPQVPNWELVGDDKLRIRRRFEFADFGKSMVFVNQVADLAESEGHHPNIFIAYNKVTLTLTTHVAGGLTENDFILAAKINKISQN